MHGREQEVTLGGTRVLLYPIFHPAAALYTPRMLDAAPCRLRPPPGDPRPRGRAPGTAARARSGARPEPAAVQLGLF